MTFVDDPGSKKEIKGLRFRDIVEAEEKTEASSSHPLRNYSFLKRVFWKINRAVVFLSKRFFVVKFFVEFGKYLFTRGRVFITILSVLEDVVSGYFENFKKVLVNKLFWGRGKFFKFTAQFLGVLLVVIVFMSYTYKSATVDSDEYAFDDANAPQTGLLVQGASTNTTIPEDRSRMDSEEYIVKTGDSLSSISEYYGLEIESILWANDLQEDSVIKPGETLEIPPGNGLSVEVESGDTLGDLAERYNANPQTIIDVNWLDYPFELHAGQELFIPEGEKPEPPPEPTAPVYSGVIHQRGTAGTYQSSGDYDPNIGRFLNWPVSSGGTVTQCYSGWHNGVDIAAPQGTDIVAAAPGTVTFAGCHSGSCPPLGSMYGGSALAWAVVVDHGNGFLTVYGHMSNIHVSSGDTVSTGQSLGKIGSTGTSYGVHVHFMLTRDGRWNTVNPAPYMHRNVCGY